MVWISCLVRALPPAYLSPLFLAASAHIPPVALHCVWGCCERLGCQRASRCYSAPGKRDGGSLCSRSRKFAVRRSSSVPEFHCSGYAGLVHPGCSSLSSAAQPEYAVRTVDP